MIAIPLRASVQCFGQPVEVVPLPILHRHRVQRFGDSLAGLGLPASIDQADGFLDRAWRVWFRRRLTGRCLFRLSARVLWRRWWRHGVPHRLLRDGEQPRDVRPQPVQRILHFLACRPLRLEALPCGVQFGTELLVLRIHLRQRINRRVLARLVGIRSASSPAGMPSPCSFSLAALRSRAVTVRQYGHSKLCGRSLACASHS